MGVVGCHPDQDGRRVPEALIEMQGGLCGPLFRSGPELRLEYLSVIKIKSAPHRWSVPAARASGEWLFGCIEPRWIVIDNSM